MSTIKIMDEILSNKIAAGEVVEKCVSIVKELVENSIDAKSKNIVIELIDSGVKSIKVIDDGIGMNKEDALLAFQRHATSKVYNENDLYRINSLGFRGEALPSIASVSDVILKTSKGDVGTLVNIKGGKLIKNESCESRKGTTLIVKNIFYNTPARLKHLKSLYSELANVVEFVNKIALANPNISFKLINNEKVLLNTDGSNNVLKVINSIYGSDITKKMIKVECENDDYTINGFISLPEVTKSNRNHIITLVNNRIVKNFELNKVINDSYHTYKPEDKYPIVILNIITDPSLIDVNIHPTKQDIKFSKIEELKDLIYNEIKNKLSKKDLSIKIENKEENIENKLNIDNKVENINYEEMIMDFSYIEDNNKKEPFPILYPIGLVKGTYIICQNELGMYLIDQHAANERVNYEYYLKNISISKNINTMLIPINIEVPNNEYIIIKENINILKDLGFEIEEFGINTFLFRSHPIWLPNNYEEEAIKKILDLIVLKEYKFDKEKFNEKIAITLSCKLSIKANENISIKEMDNLINRLSNCENPYTCPHGRPTLIFYSNYELEKLFKRVM